MCVEDARVISALLSRVYRSISRWADSTPLQARCERNSSYAGSVDRRRQRWVYWRGRGKLVERTLGVVIVELCCQTRRHVRNFRSFLISSADSRTVLSWSAHASTTQRIVAWADAEPSANRSGENDPPEGPIAAIAYSSRCYGDVLGPFLHFTVWSLLRAFPSSG